MVDPYKYDIIHQDATPKYTHFYIFNGNMNYIDWNEKSTISTWLAKMGISIVGIWPNKLKKRLWWWSII